MKRPPQPSEIDTDQLLQVIAVMELHGLRQLWQRRWGAPPRLQSKQMLRLLLAWRLQAEISGGLDPHTRKRLRQTSIPRPAPPPVGTQLTREYKGVLHTVVVEADGVKYAGGVYGSLSEVARAITGTHWNGPQFFGLRRK